MDDYLLVGAVATYVETRVCSDIDYSDLEKVVGFSLPHLRAIFSRRTGQPLARYIMSRRIAWAAFDVVHTGDTLLEIAGCYGFSNPDTFTRAFKRVTGHTPQEFRKMKPPVGRAILCAGVYGVSIDPAGNERIEKEMNNIDNQKHISDGSVILYGVPKVHYGAYNGCTPYPIALKAAANYTGIDLSYEDAMVMCGAAFRLVWDTTQWNGGNVDVVFTYDDPSEVYRTGIEALGYEFKLLGRDESASVAEPMNYPASESVKAKNEFIAFIKESLDRGVPVIALGIIGPPEACLITGYRDNGQTLLGWNVFQDAPDFASGVEIDESGYFITSSWWENKDTVAVMSIGEKTGRTEPLKAVIDRAITVLEGRQCGNFAKGIAAYDAWKKAILDDSQFTKDMIVPLIVERMMCQGDAADCISDGRSNAHKYFKKLADLNPEQPLYAKIAEQFAVTAACAGKMYETLGGWERGETQMQALMKTEIRYAIGELIDKCKAADENALALMKELASII